jgi:hypothetical protein
VYGEVLGLRSEVAIDTDGVARESAIRCDFLTLMFKCRLTGFVGTLWAAKQTELRRAPVYALRRVA